MTRRLSRDMIILIIMGILLLIFAVVAALNQGTAAKPDQPGSSHNANPDGLLALYEWLPELGYHTERWEETSSFTINEKASVLFVVTPDANFAFNREEVQQLRDWVTRGHILVVVPATYTTEGSAKELLDQFNLKVVAFRGANSAITPVQPLLTTPLVSSIISTPTLELEVNKDNYVSLATLSGAKTFIATARIGNGRIYALSDSGILTNEGLPLGDNAALTLNFLAGVPSGGIISFDEYHHGFNVPADLRNLIYTTPLGQAFLYVTLIVLSFILLTGRRFGRALSNVGLPSNRRWTGDEYVIALAGLLQRGHQQKYIMQVMHDQWKSDLGKLYNVDHHMSDADFALALARRSGKSDLQNKIQNVLINLNPETKQGVNDARLQRIIRAATDLRAVITVSAGE